MPQFKVSMITVRRDIAQLQRKGTIEKIYGGVTARKGEQLTPFDVRRIKGREAKAAIAARAAQFVHDNDTVFLDSGTTTLHVLDNLSALHNVTIVTPFAAGDDGRIAVSEPQHNLAARPALPQDQLVYRAGCDTVPEDI